MKELLAQLGLTESEIAVYFALLKLGSATTGPIIKESKISSGKAYLVLDKLIQKGLVTHNIQANTKHYQPKDPRRLLDFVKEKQDQLMQLYNDIEKQLPKLQAEYREKFEETQAEIFEGLAGFKTFHEFMLDQLESGDTVWVLGPAAIANDLLGDYYSDWNARRAKKGVILNILYLPDSRNWAIKRSGIPFTNCRVLKEGQKTPMWVDIFGDYVASNILEGNPKVILLKNKEAAKGYLQLFKPLWDSAEIISKKSVS